MTEQAFVFHQEPGRAPLKMWTRGVPVEDQAMQQLRNVAALPFIHHHVAAMPDVHWGMGATVGSVIPTLGAIVPAAVGVDIGCGMMAARTVLNAGDLPDSLAGIRTAIEAAVPHGRTNNGGPADRGAWGDVPEPVHRVLRGGDAEHDLVSGLDLLVSKHPKLERASKRAPHHLGTLGTGNHFDETPGAYKPIDSVMAAQADLVEVVHELRQVVCVKG